MGINDEAHHWQYPDALSPANLNAYMRDPIQLLGNGRPRLKSTKDSNQSIPSNQRDAYGNASYTNVTWQDTGNTFFDLHITNAGYTVKTGYAGLYHLTAQVAFDGNATGDRGIQISVTHSGTVRVVASKSGTTPANPAQLTVLNCSTLYLLSESDLVTVEVWQNCGANLNVLGDATAASKTFLNIAFAAPVTTATTTPPPVIDPGGGEPPPVETEFFTTVGAAIYDPTGNVFVPVGANGPIYQTSGNAYFAFNGVTWNNNLDHAQTYWGWNAIRGQVSESGAGDPVAGTIDLIDKCAEKGIVCIVQPNDSAGSDWAYDNTNWTATHNFWTQVLGQRGDNPYLWCNYSGPALTGTTSATWLALANDQYDRVRDINADVMIVISCDDSGAGMKRLHDDNTLDSFFTDKTNVMLEWQLFGSATGLTPTQMQTEHAAMVTDGYPYIIGAYGYAQDGTTYARGSYALDEAGADFALDYAHPQGIGTFWWNAVGTNSTANLFALRADASDVGGTFLDDYLPFSDGGARVYDLIPGHDSGSGGGTTPPPPPIQTDQFYTSGGKFYTGTGQVFMPFGANGACYQTSYPYLLNYSGYTGSPVTLNGNSDKVLEWGWTAVRASIGAGMEGDEVTGALDLIDEYSAKGIVVLLDAHYPTGTETNGWAWNSSNWNNIHTFWETIIDAVGDNPYLWVGYNNEPITDDDTTKWTNMMGDQYSRIRARAKGADTMIVVQCLGFGQGLPTMRSSGILTSFMSGKHNVAIDWHNYGNTGSGTPDQKKAYWNEQHQWMMANNIPYLVGEYGYDYTHAVQGGANVVDDVTGTEWVLGDGYNLGVGSFWWNAIGTTNSVNWFALRGTNPPNATFIENNVPLTEGGQMVWARGIHNPVPPPPPPVSPGFYTDGNKMKNQYGEDITLRGANGPVQQTTTAWVGGYSFPGLNADGSPKTTPVNWNGNVDYATYWNWNAIRATCSVNESTRGLTGALEGMRSVISEYSAENKIVIATVMDATSQNWAYNSSNWNNIYSFWQQLLSTDGDNPYLWVNYANAPLTSTTSATWSELATDHYNKIRALHDSVMIVIDADDYGEGIKRMTDDTTIETFMSGKTNVVIGWHNYGRGFATYDAMRDWHWSEDRTFPYIVNAFGKSQDDTTVQGHGTVADDVRGFDYILNHMMWWSSIGWFYWNAIGTSYNANTAALDSYSSETGTGGTFLDLDTLPSRSPASADVSWLDGSYTSSGAQLWVTTEPHVPPA